MNATAIIFEKNNLSKIGGGGGEKANHLLIIHPLNKFSPQFCINIKSLI